MTLIAPRHARAMLNVPMVARVRMRTTTVFRVQSNDSVLNLNMQMSALLKTNQILEEFLYEFKRLFHSILVKLSLQNVNFAKISFSHYAFYENKRV